MICFEPTVSLLQKVLQLTRCPGWRDALHDPYILLDMAFDAWYERLDDSSWELTEISRNIEQVSAPLSNDYFLLIES
jgi:hypothetical protein